MSNKVDTTKGYEIKPPKRHGYKRVLTTCECGCKGSYWYYVKIK